MIDLPSVAPMILLIYEGPVRVLLRTSYTAAVLPSPMKDLLICFPYAHPGFPVSHEGAIRLRSCEDPTPTHCLSRECPTPLLLYLGPTGGSSVSTALLPCWYPTLLIFLFLLPTYPEPGLLLSCS